MSRLASIEDGWDAPGSPAVSADLVADVEAGRLDGPWGDSFLAFCEASGRYVLWSDRALDELERLLAVVGGGHWLELCAGDGSLAAALARRGTSVTATDVRSGVGVDQFDMRTGELDPRWTGALCIFPPEDREVTAALGRVSERVPLVLVTPKLDGLLTGTDVLDPAWAQIERVPTLEAELISRHDFCMTPGDARTIRRYARAFVIQPTTAAT